MEIYPSTYFSQKYKKLVKKHQQLSLKIDKKLQLLSENRNHPSLRLHKLSGKSIKWSISVTGDLRILFEYVSDGILLVDIGSHDEVY